MSEDVSKKNPEHVGEQTNVSMAGRTTAWVRCNLEKYPNKSLCFERAAEEFGTTAEYVRKAWYKIFPASKKCKRLENNVKNEKNKQKTVFLSEKDISERHDSYYKIRNAAQKLKIGEYVEDNDFRDVVIGMSTNEYRRPSDNSEFNIYKGRAGGKTYWGHPESISEKKKEGVFK